MDITKLPDKWRNRNGREWIGDKARHCADDLEVALTEVKRLQNIEYRHECLRSMYADEMNYLDDDLSVDLAIDEFIIEQESES